MSIYFASSAERRIVEPRRRHLNHLIFDLSPTPFLIFEFICALARDNPFMRLRHNIITPTLILSYVRVVVDFLLATDRIASTNPTRRRPRRHGNLKPGDPATFPEHTAENFPQLAPSARAPPAYPVRDLWQREVDWNHHSRPVTFIRVAWVF